jgi:HSP20 family protein
MTEAEKSEDNENKKALPRSATWSPLTHLRQEVERLFDQSEGGFWGRPFGRSLFDRDDDWGSTAFGAALAVDVAEKDGEFEITAELPGIEEKDIDVKLSEGVLTIKGEKSEEKEEEEKDYHLSERRFGSFERRFRLPENADTENISADFKNGVLKIVAPKLPEAAKEEKKIEIKPG